jgi:protein phosphatase
VDRRRAASRPEPGLEPGGRPTIVVPDPSLVVLIGPAGSGKSTFAAAHFGPEEILSSDALRAVVSGSEADQSATRPAFSILHRQLDSRLRKRRLTVVDATNVQPGARRELLRRARANRLPSIAIVFDLPPATVLERNRRRRARVVDEMIVADQLAGLRRLVDLGVIEREGFLSVYRIRQPREVEALVVERR